MKTCAFAVTRESGRTGLCGLAILIVLTLLISSIAGCGDTGPGQIKNDQTDTAQAVSDTERLYPEYSADYEGSDFNMLYFDAVAYCGWSDLPCDIYEPEMTGEVLSDAIYERNLKMEEMYNVKVGAMDYYDTNTACTLIEKQVMAGDPEYDAVFPAWNALYSMINGGYLTDLEPLFDFSMPWYDGKSRDAFSVLGKTYATISDVTFMDKMLAIVVFFNQQMVDDYGLGDIYQMVIDREWTFDNMLTMCGRVYNDLNGNGKQDKKDSYGFISQADATYELYNSAGQYYCRIDDDGVPVLSLNNELSIGIMQNIIAFMNDKSLFFNRQENNVSTVEVCNMFTENRGLFLLRQVQAAFELRNMETDFGIIPSPLMYDGQESYHTSIGYTVAITECIPAVVKDPEMSAILLDTMAAESTYNVNDTLYEVILGTKLFRDAKSKENFDIIMDNRFYDPGCVYNFGNVSGMWFESYKKGADEVSSIIAANGEKIDKAIASFVESLQNTN